ncbi:hypothetical protein B0T25DRAFT_99317 [Lasiosphaeria hispida]|uniref:Fungal N-terminal domain-containing protein n=1 Tax=Lasiosphaeria hispida TaxID=260671 RepID=A0AAJ0MHP7_9PEZI|nr:hypothetical protein B0T25DRAFT_99317 [Lasiosphaeria hispida]
MDPVTILGVATAATSLLRTVRNLIKRFRETPQTVSNLESDLGQFRLLIERLQQTYDSNQKTRTVHLKTNTWAIKASALLGANGIEGMVTAVNRERDNIMMVICMVTMNTQNYIARPLSEPIPLSSLQCKTSAHGKKEDALQTLDEQTDGQTLIEDTPKRESSPDCTINFAFDEVCNQHPAYRQASDAPRVGRKRRLSSNGEEVSLGKRVPLSETQSKSVNLGSTAWRHKADTRETYIDTTEHSAKRCRRDMNCLRTYQDTLNIFTDSLVILEDAIP